MSVSYSSPLKTTRMQAVIAAIDVAAAPAVLEIGTGGAGFGTSLATIILSDPSFTESGGVITLNGVPKSGQATAVGAAAAARIKDGNGNTIVSGLTVGLAAPSEIILNAVAISAIGQTVTISSGTITHAP